jgi:hypothetical protein
MKRTPRKPSNLSDSLHRQLGSYATAAGAAGVGLLALAQPAKAKIVYTPAHVTLGSYNLDLDQDGLTDFTFQSYCNCTAYHDWGSWLTVGPAQSKNQIWGSGSYAGALKRGVRIGPGGKFSPGKKLIVSVLPYSSNSHGLWRNEQNHYLGLQFVSQGKTHYGWARMNVSVWNYQFSALLTGYAYETVPNKPIIAGKTKGPDVITVEPASLGHLARGAAAIRAWRKETASVTH